MEWWSADLFPTRKSADRKLFRWVRLVCVCFELKHSNLKGMSASQGFTPWSVTFMVITIIRAVFSCVDTK